MKLLPPKGDEIYRKAVVYSSVVRIVDFGCSVHRYWWKPETQRIGRMPRMQNLANTPPCLPLDEVTNHLQMLFDYLQLKLAAVGRRIEVRGYHLAVPLLTYDV